MSAKPFRYYQQEANQAIYQELLLHNKCIVKMFCGTGKSLVMRNCTIVQDQNLVVYVFPSLSLIDQFYADYLHPQQNVLKISSETEATTDPEDIRCFLSHSSLHKIICITYQSFKTLLDNLGDRQIDVCIYDEAHHAVGETYQKLIFDTEGIALKQVFFTATPKNANGVVMYDRDKPDDGMCGRLVYDYSYLRGMNEGYLNPFEVRIDLSTDNTNCSIYESIARAVLASGNNRVLTFHSDVNTERDTSVFNFVDEPTFQRTFTKVLMAEFPDKRGFYQKVSMIGLGSKINGKIRRQLLDTFDQTPDGHVIVIASCETIGEGIDTKNANMCVFVDPKSSYVKIIQNIGRIVRKQFGVDKPNSTILIPCWVDKTKYEACEGDREKCDEVIRQDMSQAGNFNGVLNVLSALKQEDEDLYDICLNYPDSFSPQEIESNLDKQGFQMDDPAGDGTLFETLEHVLDTYIDYDDYEDCDTEEETLMRLAEDNDVQIEIHTTSLENPVIKYNSECQSGETVRLYKDEEDQYRPIVMKDGINSKGVGLYGPNRSGRLNVRVHTNPDVKILWNLVSDLDVTKDVCSCIIDCEVVKYDAMEVAKGIVERTRERGGTLPQQISKSKQTTPNSVQEAKDGHKLQRWKQALKGSKNSTCSNELRDYLDKHLPGWRIDIDEKAMKDAIEIITRAKEKGLPHQIPKKKQTTNELIQENKHACKLYVWKKSLKEGSSTCPYKVENYLDEHLPGWKFNCDDKALGTAKAIVERAKERGRQPRQHQKLKHNSQELMQEHKDAVTLTNWKQSLREGAKGRRCPNKILDFLDENLPNWRTNSLQKHMEQAQSIVERVAKRGRLPRNITRNHHLLTQELIQEAKDAKKINRWKDALKGKGHNRCSDEVRDYLDVHLPGWREVEDEESESTTKKKSMKRANPSKKAFLEEPEEHRRKRVKSELSILHQRYKTLTSANLQQEFLGNPDLWHTYHAISEQNEQSFPEQEIPRNRVIQELEKVKTRRTKLVVDMGCGKAQIAQHFQSDPRFQFLNFDHIACNETVTPCDIKSVPIEEHSAEICILSLAMWGSNCREYVQEAYRILESNGKLYMVEPTKRWSNEDLQDAGKLQNLLQDTGFRILEQSIEKFSLFVCMKV